MIDPFSTLAEVTALLYVLAIIGCIIWRIGLSIYPIVFDTPKLHGGILLSKLFLLGFAFALILELVHLKVAGYSLVKMLLLFRGWIVIFSQSAIISVIIVPLTLIFGGITVRAYRWMKQRH